MRIASLHLKAYGPFDAAVLDFDRPAAGLQLVYGPNEQGKSTALRAIGALLFGFPARTDDHFGRDYGALRVGAVLDDGARRLALMRRKGSKHTLFEFDADTGLEHPERLVDQAAIDALLGGVDAARFGMMYGLGSAQLRAGGRALVDSGSELGATLFEAASGVLRLRAVSDALSAQADALFVPRGRNPKLNATLIEFESRQDEARAAGMRPRDWQQRRDALQRAGDELARLEAMLRERRERLAHVERLLGLGPQVARHETLARGLAALGGAPLLPADAGERLAAWRLALEQSQAAVGDAQDRLRRHREALAALRVSQAHLDAAPEIAQLAGRLDDFEAARVAMPGLQAAERTARLALGRALAAIATAGAPPVAGLQEPGPPAHPETVGDAPERAAAWLPSRATVVEARQLLAARLTTEDRRAAARAGLARAAQAHAEARTAQDAAGAARDLAAVEAALEAGAAAGDVEHRIAVLQARLDIADLQLDRQAAALGGTTPEALVRLERIPAAELERVEAASQVVERAQAALQARRAEPADTLPMLRTQLADLTRQGRVIDRDALALARSHRDARLAQLQADPAGRDARDALAALGPAIGEADRLADARFDDASRLAAMGALSQRIGQLDEALAGFAADEARLRQEAEQLARGWTERLAACGLPVLDPPAHRDWALRHQRFVEAMQARDAIAAERRAESLDLARHLALLRGACGGAGLDAPELSTLAALLAHARRLVDEARRAAGERVRLRDAAERTLRDRNRQQAALDELDRELAEGARAWARVAGALRLDSDVPAARLAAQLEDFDALRDALTDWEHASLALQAAAARLDLFRADAAALAQRVAAGAGAPPAGTEPLFVAACRTGLAEAERARDERLRLCTEAASLEATIAAAARRRDDAQAGIAALQALAGAADLTGLHEAVERSESRRDLARQAASLEAMIRAATGAAHHALVAEAAGADVASLQAEQTGLRQSIAADEAGRDAALAERMRAQTACDAVDGDGAAARAVEAMRERLAASSRLATDWARLRLARELLDHAVQRHQQRAQGPLLAAAARWFARLTGGRWRDLRPDWSGDTQVLLAEREDGARLPVDALSEGTADALYLALRLAAIDVRLVSAPPVPLLLDDLLMTFDDDRAVLALQGLAELGQRNQVVYFTHHRHLVDLAQRSLPPGSVAVRRLERGPAGD